MSSNSSPEPSAFSPEQKPVLHTLGRFIVKRRYLIIIIGIIWMIVSGIIAAGTLGKLTLSRFEVPDSESNRVSHLLEENFGTGSSNLVLLVTAKTGTVDSKEVKEAGLALTEELASEEALHEAGSYWSRGSTPTLRSDDGKQALILAHMDGSATEVRVKLGELSPKFTRENELIKVEVGGQDEIFRQVGEYARQDFLRAELIILPAVFAMLVFMFRRIRVALLTLGVGFFAMLGTLAALGGVVLFTEVSTFALNLTLVMGLALGIDYSLFIVSRFREEIATGKNSFNAAVRTVETAGRTVIFSGVTVAASTAVLFVFPFPFLQTFAYTGIFVVMSGLIGSVIILPAALAILGHRVARKGNKPSTTSRKVQTGLWYKSAITVMRRPLLYGGIALLILLTLGSPITNLKFGLPDDRSLPADASSRIVQEQKRDGFQAEETDAIHIVAPALKDPNSVLEVIDQYSRSLSLIPGIFQVDSIAGSFSEGNRIAEYGEHHERFNSENAGTWLSVIPSQKSLEEDVPRLVGDIREQDAPFDVLVGGYPADMTDFRSALLERIPLALILILVISFTILFLMSGSILLPLKATLLNMFSLSIMFGALVWVFQEGNLSQILNFTSTGTIEPSIPILMFCIAYGLSMDYEVFILSRIKEEYDRTGKLEEAVAIGIQRSGPLVTAAAVILAFSFAAYATGDVVFLKMLGVGMTLAVLVDATLIRGVLLPSFMKLAGRANWWAPAGLRRIYDRFGISEGDSGLPFDDNKGNGVKTYH
ncbi:MMPL family transporter [Metabacillus sp. Hm71]|uniref:MMPL family transporter n=1 Tax=Metabacillus sp. Hm71 TaxID=3450743 RepID=UPI003F426195